MNLDATKFLEDLTGRHAKAYTAAVSDMLVAVALNNRPKWDAARTRLGRIIAETMGVAEVLGASLVLRDAAGAIPEQEMNAFAFGAGTSLHPDDAIGMLRFASTPTQTILPRVTLTEALEDFVTRAPVTIRDAAERTAQRIAQLYSEGRVAAFAKSAEQAVTERAQALISQAIREGVGEAGAGRALKLGVDQIRQETEAWTEAYSRMAFRTNVNTAVTAGRFRQVQDQDIKAVIPAFRFDAVGDSDTRHNHGAADGLIFKVDNPVWNTIAPPLGYNCRCQVTLMTLPQLRRMGRVDSTGGIREDRLPTSAHPDDGFRHGGRPDLLGVGG